LVINKSGPGGAQTPRGPANSKEMLMTTTNPTRSDDRRLARIAEHRPRERSAWNVDAICDRCSTPAPVTPAVVERKTAKRTPWKRLVVGIAGVVALLASLVVAGPTAGAYANTGGQSIAAQARVVRTLAELQAASPAVRQLIQTPVGGSFTRTPSVGPPEATPDVGNTGWSALPYPGCWSWNVYYSAKNALGWTLFTIGFNNVNDCWTGTKLLYGVGAVRYFNVHWGWGYCGVTNEFNGWVSQNWGWQNSGVFEMTLGPSCAVEGGWGITDQSWGNGHFNWVNA
jgi:hypothetical protein